MLVIPDLLDEYECAGAADPSFIHGMALCIVLDGEEEAVIVMNEIVVTESCSRMHYVRASTIPGDDQFSKCG